MKNVAVAAILFALACPAFAGRPITASSDTAYDHDVGVANYVRWTHCYVWDTVWFRPLIVNYGRYPESFHVRMDVYADDSSLIHTELIGLTLAIGDSIEVVPPIPYRTFDSAGFYLMFACTTQLAGDENPDNNGGQYWAAVVDSVGIEEPVAPPGPIAPGPKLWPNPCRGRVWFQDHQPASLYSPDGRLVAILQPGANDLRVTPGVFFVRAGPTRSGICRLLVQR